MGRYKHQHKLCTWRDDKRKFQRKFCQNGINVTGIQDGGCRRDILVCKKIRRINNRMKASRRSKRKEEKRGCEEDGGERKKTERQSERGK